jgi:hypothetical protein
MATENNDKTPSRGYTPTGGLVPIPDPTVLTTQALLREVAALNEKVEIRFAATDKIITHVEEQIRARSNDITTSSMHLRELMLSEMGKIKVVTDEVFQRIDVQFVERDKRTEQLALASSTAIATALQAAKEAVGAQNTSNSIAIAKSESSTLESLRQLRELFLSETKAINEKVDDLKSRLDRGEGKGSGVVERRETDRASVGQGLAIASVVISIVVAMVAIVVAVAFHH